ncbi:MAG: gamma-glutamyl-gamma-aminobutyrate hydrolase family protein [Candidatus Kryptoniota bacterium]
MHRIAVSDCGEKLHHYLKYIQSKDGVDVVVFSYKRGNIRDIDMCDGLVLTGGEDVTPELYGDWPDETVHSNPERDGFEYKLIEKALEKDIPILGICRGLQIVNVYLGGTLILDLEKYQGKNHRKISQFEDRYHGVSFTEGSVLSKFINVRSGEVNSAHHQAADRIGTGLKVTARADDGTVESLESSSPGGKITLVQWHPERLNMESPFARGVLELFISNIENKKK